jgi:hypothetical protein
MELFIPSQMQFSRFPASKQGCDNVAWKSSKQEIADMAKDEEGGEIHAHFGGFDFARIEDWRRSQPRIPTLSEAIRVLVKSGLDAKEQPKGRAA